MMDTMNDLPASFGTVERELSETKANKCSTETLSVKFSENFVLITESYKFCCYPPMYNKLILPKLRITNCEIEKGGLKKCPRNSAARKFIGAILFGRTSLTPPRTLLSRRRWMINLGWILLVIGLIGLIAGGAMSNNTGPNPNSTLGGTLLGVGLLLFLAGLYFVIRPCCLKHYIVKLHLLKKETKAGKRSKDDAIPNPVVIKMNTQPDEKYIMEYVYGHLADKSMPYYHTASHLVEMGMMVPMEMRELDKVKLR